MAESGVTNILLRLLLKAQRHRLINRLIGFLLFSAAFYLFLLLALMVFDVPLLVFHLLLFVALSLLPLFLLLGLEAEQTVALLRRIDEHCQTEAYLATASPRHRSFLEPKVKSLLKRRQAERVIRFRILKVNRRLAVAVLGLFALLQLTSLATFKQLTPGLAAAGLKKLRAQSEATVRSAAPAPDLSREQRAEREAAGDSSAGLPSASRERTGSSRERDPDAGQAELFQDPAGSEESYFTPEGAGPGGSQGSQPEPWVPLPQGEGAFGSALKGALEQSPDPGAEAGQSPAGIGEAGKALMDSPLRDYAASSARRSIQTEGGSKLVSDSSPSPARDQPLLRALFGDFPVPASGRTGFDPAIEGLRRRYLELLDERY